MQTGKLITNKFKTGQNEGCLCNTNQSLFIYFYPVLPSITEKVCQGQESWVLVPCLKHGNIHIPLITLSLISLSIQGIKGNRNLVEQKCVLEVCTTRLGKVLSNPVCVEGCPCFEQEVALDTSQGPFQPELFCDSLWLNWYGFRLPYLTPYLPFGKWFMSNWLHHHSNRSLYKDRELLWYFCM